MKKLPASAARQVTARDWWSTGWRILVLIIGEVGGIVLCIHLFPESTGLIVWVLCVIFLVYWLINFHTRTFGYQCPHCHQHFALSVIENAITLHGFDKHGTWYYLRCPKCHKRSKCRIRRIVSSG